MTHQARPPPNTGRDMKCNGGVGWPRVAGPELMPLDVMHGHDALSVL